mmetsp:Transcript_81933/g.187527  ORF Transcript_81933/g.187527 Transcript_81933/m.187527 type:complete len:206 (-) Transcript_81933:369-986(-)
MASRAPFSSPRALRPRRLSLRPRCNRVLRPSSSRRPRQRRRVTGARRPTRVPAPRGRACLQPRSGGAEKGWQRQPAGPDQRRLDRGQRGRKMWHKLGRIHMTTRGPRPPRPTRSLVLLPRPTRWRKYDHKSTTSDKAQRRKRLCASARRCTSGRPAGRDSLTARAAFCSPTAPPTWVPSRTAALMGLGSIRPRLELWPSVDGKIT